MKKCRHCKIELTPIDLKEMHPTINDLPRYIDITGRSPEEIDAFKTKLLTQIDAKCEIQTKNEPPKILTGGKSRYKKKKRTIKKRKSYRKQKKGKYNRTKSRK